MFNVIGAIVLLACAYAGTITAEAQLGVSHSETYDTQY
jgi:hypothetical protein